MKISIYDFKSISSVVDYELRPLTILSGTNSSGKSSFIQLLLLFKQTLELDSARFPLYLGGEYYKVQQYKDIIRNKDISKKIRVVFEIEKREFLSIGAIPSLYDSFPDYTCVCNISFASENGIDINVDEFFITYQIKGADIENQYIKFFNSSTSKKIESSNDYFGKAIWQNDPIVTSIGFTSVFPNFYDIKEVKESDGPKGKITDTITNREVPNIDSIKSFIINYFKNVYYVGPIRVEPLDEYSFKNDHESVGVNGENVAQVLELFRAKSIQVFLPEKSNDDTLIFKSATLSLIEATSFWICKIFKFGEEISVKKIGDSYAIYLKTNDKLETTIKHVGFGISQILPIIVEGLLMPSGATLILEQPEIHLHPKIQSHLFDYLHSLILANKNIIVETHSDHFITRMRRRIAEDDSNQLGKEIKLTFVECTNSNLLFRNIDLDNYGTLDYFPEDFIEKTDTELKAIVKAQMKKRISESK